MEKNKTTLDVNLDEINETISMLLCDMINSIAEYINQLPNKTLDLESLISKSHEDKELRSMLPIIKDGCSGYVSKIYLNDWDDVYAKKNNDFDAEYRLDEMPFEWLMELCEFIQTYC